MSTLLGTYKGIDIESNLSGWFSAHVPGKGWLKADTVGGLKKLIREAKKDDGKWF